VLHFNFAFYVYFWLVKILSSNMSNCLFGLTSIHGDFTPSISSCQLGQWIPGGANLDLAIEYFIILMEGPGSGLLAPNAQVTSFPLHGHPFSRAYSLFPLLTHCPHSPVTTCPANKVRN
jgi:hypothetical protein